MLVAALVAWAVAVEQMRGMDTGPGTDLGSFGWFAGIWLTMTVAMMLPSAAPTTLIFSQLGRASETALFVGGYLLAWTAFGATAYVVSHLARELAPSFVAWDDRGPWVAGAALVAAGLYQRSASCSADAAGTSRPCKPGSDTVAIASAAAPG